MSERAAQVDRGPEPEERVAGASQDHAFAPGPELATQLSMLGNQRVQRILTEGAASPGTLQRQEEDEEEGPTPIPPAVQSAGLVAEVLIQGALANLQTKNRDDVPAAAEMVTSAISALDEVKGTVEGLDNPLLMSQLYGYRQSLVADSTIIGPHIGAMSTLENAESHLENVSMAFAGDFIASASSGSGE